MTTTRYAACSLCEASCGLQITLEGDRVTSVRGHDADPLSRGHICPKAIALQDLHHDPDRLRRPVRRVGEGWEEIAWDEAFRVVAQGIHRVQSKHGRDALAVYLGNPNVHSLGAMTHNPQLVRAIGSRSVYSATSVDQLPHHVVAWALFGHQFLLPVPDIDRTDLLVLIGHNPMASNGSMWTVPDFPQRRRELAARGGRLIVIDPRRTETVRIADQHLAVRPGTDAWVLLALVREVLASGRARPAAYVDGVEQVRAAVEAFTPERAEEHSGLPAEAVRELAAALLAARSAAVHGRMGVSTQEFGVLCQWAVQVLTILLGSLDRPGGLMLTSPAVDLVGRGLLGPGRLGRTRTRVRGARTFGSELPVATRAEEMTTPGAGQVRGLLTVAGNPVSSTPGGQHLDAALTGLEFMASIDFYVNETTRHAQVILPPTGPLERDHYDLIFHTLAVRNTARFSPALLPAAPGARHDWQIARDLARALFRARGKRDLGLLLRLGTPPRIALDGLLRLSPGRLSVRRLARTPGGVDLGPLRSQLPGRLRTANRRIQLAAPVALEDLDRLAAVSPPAAAETLLLIGRRHQRDNNSWMHNAPRLTSGRARHHLLVHPDDLAARGIPDGARVRVHSASGEVEVEVAASTDLMRGVVSLPHGYGHARPGVRLEHAATLPGASINDLTDPARLDEASGNAVLNGVPVTISLVA